MMRFKKGFSLIESLASIAIISIVLVMICIFYTYMMRVSAKGLDISIASQVAEEKLNQIASIYGGSDSLSITGISEYPFIKTGCDVVGDTKFYYFIRVSEMPDSKMNLCFADVVVFWLSDDIEEKIDENGNVESTVDNNEVFMGNLKTTFSNKTQVISDSAVLSILQGKTTNLNEGYRFIKLSRIVSKS